MIQLDRASVRIPQKINFLRNQNSPDRIETGYRILSRRRFDCRRAYFVFDIFAKSSFEKSVKMNSVQSRHSLNLLRMAELLNQSEVRSGIGAVLVKEIDFLDRVFR